MVRKVPRYETALKVNTVLLRYQNVAVTSTPFDTVIVLFLFSVGIPRYCFKCLMLLLFMYIMPMALTRLLDSALRI